MECQTINETGKLSRVDKERREYNSNISVLGLWEDGTKQASEDTQLEKSLCTKDKMNYDEGGELK